LDLVCKGGVVHLEDSATYDEDLVFKKDGVTLDCKGGRINGTGSGNGITLVYKKNEMIKNCIISNFLYGIWIPHSFNIRIHNNNISSNRYGISLNSESSNNIITKNNIQVNDTGIFVFSSSNNNVISWNTIINNNASPGVSRGVYINSAYSNEISDNIINSNGLGGVSLFKAGQNKFYRNQICFNNGYDINTGSISYSNTYLDNYCDNVSGDTNKWNYCTYPCSEIPEEPHPPPSIEITSPSNNQQFNAGDNVNIQISFSNLPSGEQIIVKEKVGAFTEYAKVYPAGSVSSPLVITIPALPVYVHNTHTITVRTSRGGLTDSVNYIVDSSLSARPSTDMLIVTNPDALMNQFNRDDWGDTDPSLSYDSEDVLFLIKNAVMDNGVLMYTHRSSSRWISREIFLEAFNDLQPDYLLILGGDNVIPYSRSNFNGELSSSDAVYWDFDGDFVPELRYSRLPTFKGQNQDCTLEKYLNYQIYNTTLHQNHIASKNIDKALFIEGRDRSVIGRIPVSGVGSDASFTREAEHARTLFSSLDTLKEYEIDIPLLSDPVVLQSYNKDDSDDTDFFFITGHGLPRFITTIGPSNTGLSVGSYTFNDPRSKVLCLYNSTDSRVVKGDDRGTEDDDYFCYRVIENSGEIIRDGGNLNSPVILTDSCLTSNILQNENSISNLLMAFGSSSYAGYGTSVNVFPGHYLTMAYLDELSESQKIGEIFRDTITSSIDSMKDSMIWSWSSEDNRIHALKNLRYFIQYGYPKLEVTPNLGSSSSSSEKTDFKNGQKTQSILSESIPQQISFVVTNYTLNSTTNDTLIDFQATLNGEPVNSSFWALQGNPILPIFYVTFPLHENSSITSIEHTTNPPEFIGEYSLMEMPGTYNGPLYEHYPLNYSVYMPTLMEWNIVKKIDGNRSLTLQFFPFRYDTENHSITLYHNFTINISHANTTSRINFVSLNNSYTRGELVIISVNSTSSTLLTLDIDGVPWIVNETSTGLNNLSVNTSELGEGFHIANIQILENGFVVDESLVGFSISGSDINVTISISNTIIQQGNTSYINVSIHNEGSVNSSINISLIIYSENTTHINDLGTYQLTSNESITLSNVPINTENLSSGSITTLAETKTEFETFKSNIVEFFIIPSSTPAPPSQDTKLMSLSYGWNLISIPITIS